MISISKISSSGQASSYFSQADYYTKGEDGVDISSSWVGKGAEKFGLNGAVDSDDFKNLLEGKSPDGQQVGTFKDGKAQHTPAWDLTFSAPKSVSLMALVGDDKRLLIAHKKAVDTAMKHLENNYLKGRMHLPEGMTHVDLKNMIAAQFTHTTSRDLDPQLHTHNVLMNLAFMENEKAKSLDSTKFYNPSKTLGYIYRNELALSSKELGYDVDWNTKTGLFELASVDKNAIQHFSKRRQEIERVAKERGYTDAKGMEKATVNSRQAKQNVPSNEVLDKWDKEAEEIGFTPESIKNEALNKSKKDNANYNDINNKGGKTYLLKGNKEAFKDASEVVDYAIKILSQREAAFTKESIIQTAISASQGNFRVNEILNSLGEEFKTGRLLDSSHTDLVTTKESVRRENYVLDLLEHSKNEFKAIGTVAQVREMAANKTLRPDQEQALYSLSLSQDGINGLQGWAGVGKTYMLDAYIKLAQNNGYKVEGFAPTGEAAKVLQKDTGIESNTIASLLMANQQEKNIQKTVGKSNKIWVIDEASLVNLKDMADLVTDARKRGVRIVLSGDYKQLGSVDAGKPYHQMVEHGMRTGNVTDIVRQKDENLKGSVYDVINRDIKSAFNKLDKHFVENENRDTLLDTLVTDYLERSPENQKNTLLVVPDNETRRDISNNIRDGLKEQNVIDKSGIKADLYSPVNMEDEKKKYAFNYEVGMSVRFHRAYKTLGTEAESYYSVIDVKGDVVTLSDGKNTIKWEPKKVAGGAKYGVTPYYKNESELSKGDRIAWRDKNKELGMKNGDKATVSKIEGKNIHIMLPNGTSKVIDITDHRNRHFEHAYAATVYAAQGHTYENVSALAESWRKNLVNQTSFYVSTSRTKQNLTLYTDNKDKLQQGIEKRLGTKTSGLSVINEQQKFELQKQSMKNTAGLHALLGMPDSYSSNKEMNKQDREKTNNQNQSNQQRNKQEQSQQKQAENTKSFDLGYSKGQHLP